MKTLDSVITRVLSNGEKHSVSSKCAEMDREVILVSNFFCCKYLLLLLRSLVQCKGPSVCFRTNIQKKTILITIYQLCFL